MKLFIKNLLLFSLIAAVILTIGIFAPATPKVKSSLLFAKLDKDNLLRNTPAPRLILIGGSNLSFGINSNLLKDSLKINPINTAVHAGIGLVYMLRHNESFIKSGDLVIVAPEYDQFYGNFAYGQEELLRTVLDVSRSEVKSLTAKQWSNIFPYIFKYAASKFNPKEYKGYKNKKEVAVYERSSFNNYGDASAHWTEKSKLIAPFPENTQHFNDDIINELVKFKAVVEAKGAKLYITFPGFQASSFNNNSKEVALVKSKLTQKNFKLLGTPEEYKIPDSLAYNTPYHLIKQGLDLRTELLIHDIKANHLIN